MFTFLQAKKFQYDQSLFVRLQKQRQDVVYLLRYDQSLLGLFVD
jgi:hypothetical protein